MSALAADGRTPGVLAPHWLGAGHRRALAEAVRAGLEDPGVHPVDAVHLADVLTELHVAAARDVVWPAPAARVRRVTGWDADVLPVRLSARERAAALALPDLAPVLRRVLGEGRP
ncbi:hypothetical protein [Geodermatophilus marinus]|uniref:hypothetical protein n=1 Tax=Geodermatophilus sp. LHW52908 TaxID=2303986 RepID=UPI000E3EC922|nr:hypothetical protein [Geodermatophilus sp. LHW52908]RFU22889.1 hypothetical protein D0Z06_03235 [Geodermatophilus sp. LHW52908]